VDSLDDLAAVDALQVDRRDAEVAVPELTLDDDQWHALASHIDGVGVAQLVRREATPHSCRSRGTPQLGACRRRRPVPTARRAGDYAEHRADRQRAAQIQPGLELFEAPRVHADLAAPPALAASDQERAATLIQIGFSQGERLLDAQTGPPQDDDQTAQSVAVRALSSGTPRMTAMISSTFGGSAG
jgi:hypothetical protein